MNKLNPRLEKGIKAVEELPEDYWPYPHKEVVPSKGTCKLLREFCAEFPQEFQPTIYPEPGGSVHCYFRNLNVEEEVYLVVWIHEDDVGNLQYEWMKGRGILQDETDYPMNYAQVVKMVKENIGGEG